MALNSTQLAGGPASDFRGTSLAGCDRVARTAAAISQADQFDIGPVLAIWERAVAGPAWTGPLVWMHGDLHPANLLVDGGRLSAVIDFGLLGVGDPACDLMIALTYLRADARDAFRDVLAVDEATWSRGRGWALELGYWRTSSFSETALFAVFRTSEAAGGDVAGGGGRVDVQVGGAFGGPEPWRGKF